MHSIYRGDDGEFNRFQHAAAAPPEHYGAQTFPPQLQSSLGGIRVMQQQQQQQRSQQQQQPAQHQQHQARRNMQPSSQQQQARQVLREPAPSRKERGDLARPHHRNSSRTSAGGHDSNDDDGETSSASEDSVLSGGYPSSPQAAEAKAASSFYSAKRAEPSTAFSLPPSSQRPRIELQKSDPVVQHQQQAGWLDSSSSFESGAGARQLPRLAALESLQPPQLRKEPTEQQQHRHNHDRNQHHHHQHHHHQHAPSVGGSHGAGGPTSLVMAAPMQLPALSEARALANKNTSSPAAGASSFSSSLPSHSSPILRASSSTTSCPPSPPQQHQHRQSSSGNAASQQHHHHHYQQQQQRMRRVSSPSPPPPPSPQQRQQQQQQRSAHRHLETPGSRYQLPVPAGMHTENMTNPAATGGATKTTASDHLHHHHTPQQRWLPSSERRQVPRIEALSSAEAVQVVQPAPAPLSNNNSTAVRRQQWDAAPWSKAPPAHGSSIRGFDQTSQSSSLYCCDSSPEEQEGGWARQEVGRRWASREEEEWAASRGGAGFRQQRREEGRIREEAAAAQQPSSRVLRHPESGSCRASCSPLTARHHDQINRPPSPTGASASVMDGRRGHEAWAAAAATATATAEGGGGGGGGRQSSGVMEGDGGGGEWATGSAAEQHHHHQQHHHQQHQQQHQNQLHHRTSGTDGKQILQRYLTNLYPKASREVWSHDEEEVLWRAQKEYGNAWSYISGLLPGRSENAVKNHWYTQMRMFIGQRGNHSASSKPCPPPSAKAPTKAPAATSTPMGSRQQPRALPHHRKLDDERSMGEDFNSVRRPAPSSTVGATYHPTSVDAAAAAATATAAATAAAATAAAAAATAAAAAAAAAVAEAEAEAQQADRGNMALEGEEHESQAEIEARADAVAALGMLFAQRGDSSLGAEDGGVASPRKGHERAQSASSGGGGDQSRQRGGAVDRRSPVFNVGVAGRV